MAVHGLVLSPGRAVDVPDVVVVAVTPRLEVFRHSGPLC
ncbi:hypothetical protein I552_1549 [Mycobacterium xenopi 3993]|nr:hypothetical protein I552_1549 [Mycobacterium xenopi 3993]